MTITANSQGVVTGKFTIPSGVPSGTKLVTFEGSGGSYGTATFFGEGVVETRTLRNATTVIQTLGQSVPVPADNGWTEDNWWMLMERMADPLAQTFSLPGPTQVGGVELFVSTKGSTPILVQLRETSVGMPTQTILAEARLEPSAITANAWNRFQFDVPATLRGNTEYAIVALCNDADAALAIAEMGKWDSNAMAWVSGQPYTVGVLLSSSNAVTWTAHQDRDLAFRLLEAQYQEALTVVDLGDVSVTAATDIMALAAIAEPSADANGDLQITLPDSTVVSMGVGQVLRLSSPVTGDINIKARLRSSLHMSAAIAPGTQVIAGKVKSTGDYVSRAIDADAEGCNIRVIFDAELPSGSGVQVYYSGVDAGDTWQSMSQTGTAKPLGDGVYEYQYYATDVEEARIRVKLVLSGTIAARPQVANLRVIVT